MLLRTKGLVGKGMGTTMGRCGDHGSSPEEAGAPREQDARQRSQSGDPSEWDRLEIRSLRILPYNVVGLSPSAAAAPLTP